MKDCHDFYFKCDVLRLTDVFQILRINTLKNYGLCPSHYLSAPALSWDSMLNMTKIKVQHISGPDMYIFFEKGMRGGVSYISNRYSKAHKKYLKSCYPKQGSKHIYLDTNNLYGYAMSKFLPISGFKWVDPKKLDLNKYTSNSSKRCVLELKIAAHYNIPIGNVKKLVPNFLIKKNI